MTCIELWFDWLQKPNAWPTTARPFRERAPQPRRLSSVADPLMRLGTTATSEIWKMAQGKTALFIDGPNLYATVKALNFDIDYKRLLKIFEARGQLVRAFYFTVLIEDQDQDYVSMRPLIDWLDYNGYMVVTKMAKEFADPSGRRKVKGDMDIELAVSALELARHLDEAVIFSGDGDFRSLVQALQRQGVRVTVVSTIKSHPAMLADELRRQADVFVDLEDLRAAIGREPSQRAVQRDLVTSAGSRASTRDSTST